MLKFIFIANHNAISRSFVEEGPCLPHVVVNFLSSIKELCMSKTRTFNRASRLKKNGNLRQLGTYADAAIMVSRVDDFVDCAIGRRDTLTK